MCVSKDALQIHSQLKVRFSGNFDYFPENKNLKQ